MSHREISELGSDGWVDRSGLAGRCVCVNCLNRDFWDLRDGED
jgi:hypothetical protein